METWTVKIGFWGILLRNLSPACSHRPYKFHTSMGACEKGLLLVSLLLLQAPANTTAAAEPKASRPSAATGHALGAFTI